MATMAELFCETLLTETTTLPESNANPYSDSHPKFNVLIVDGNPFRSEQLRLLIEENDGFSVCADCFSAVEAINAVERHRPDLIFIDVNISRAETLKQLYESRRQPFIVYVVAGADRLQSRSDKPTFIFEGKKTPDLAVVLSRLLSRHARRRAGRSFPSLAVLSGDAISVLRGKLAVKSHGRLVVLSLAEILKIEQHQSGSVVCAGGCLLPTRHALRHFAVKLPEEVFWQLNSRLIVNARRIREVKIEPGTQATITLEDGSTIAARERYARRLMQFLNRSFGLKAV